MSYRVNEIFYSLQGEGARAGTPNVFVRFTGCNLKCSVGGDGGFDCDTEFSSGVDLDAEAIVAKAIALVGPTKERVGVIFTGGEPMLQLDAVLLLAFVKAGFYTCIETNGTRPIPDDWFPGLLSWVSVSPKTAEHTLRVDGADEVRYVRNAGQGIPKPRIKALHYYLSPAYDASRGFRDSLPHVIKLVKKNPRFALSIQRHKLWNIR